MGSKFTAAGIAWGCIFSVLAKDEGMIAIALAGAAGFGMLGLLASFGLTAKRADPDGPLMKWLLVVPIDLLLIGCAVVAVYYAWTTWH